MSEVVRASVKAPETKKKSQVSQVQKVNFHHPASSPVEQILYMQRTIGNLAVQRLMKSGALQAKLRLGAPGDVYEQEADRVADAVMRMPETQVSKVANSSRITGNTVQRKCQQCTKKLDKEEEEIHTKEAKGKTPEIMPEVENSISAIRSGGQPLPESLRTFFENRFGQDFSQVRVHMGQKAAESANSINALAYTVGKDVVFGGDQYQPGTSMGKHLLAHELTHVVQQSGTNTTIQRMQPCPHSWPNIIPSGWQSYHGPTAVFHCGFRVILENRIPTPDDPQNECVYDQTGALVDLNHPYAGCRGTPNQYDSSESPISHTIRDTGGILYAGPEAFITSRVYDISQAIAGAIRVVQTVGNIAGSIIDALGRAIVLGILTGRATVDPTNWIFRGLPSRSIRHLNVIGGILSSISWSQNLNNLLINITRRLDSFPISGLINEIEEDINQALRNSNPNALQVSASNIGTLSLLHLIDFLHSQGIIQYVRPPEDIAREELNE